MCPGTCAEHVVISRVCISVLLRNALKRENATCLQGTLICTLGCVLGGEGAPLWRLIGLSVLRLALHLAVQGWGYPWEQRQAGAPSQICPVAALGHTQVAVSPPRSCSVAPCGCPNALSCMNMLRKKSVTHSVLTESWGKVCLGPWCDAGPTSAFRSQCWIRFQLL